MRTVFDALPIIFNLMMAAHTHTMNEVERNILPQAKKPINKKLCTVTSENVPPPPPYIYSGSSTDSSRR
jgi:hypothetical protein